MATVKAINPVTGASFDINASEFESQYKPLGWTLESSPTQQQPVQANQQQQLPSQITSQHVAIDGAKYNTREKQTGFFTDIQPYENTLYGVPKTETTELAEPIDYNAEISAKELAEIGNIDEMNKWPIQDMNLRNQLKNEVISMNGSGLADADFIDKVAKAFHGRPATKDELQQVGTNKYGLIGATRSDVLSRFGYQSNKPVYDIDGSIIDTDEEGIPDVSMSKTWTERMYDLLNDITTLMTASQDEIDLMDQYEQAKGSAELGVLNLGQQLGTAMPLIQGEQQYLIDKANIQLQTLANRVGVLQGARQNQLLAKQTGFNMEMMIQDQIMKEKQMIFDEMKFYSTNAQSNLALLLDSFQKAGGVDTSKLTSEQKLQISNLAKQAGLDGTLVLSALDALYNQSQLDMIIKAQKDLQSSLPQSYREWELAGMPGTYANWVKGNEGGIDLPIIKVNGVDYFLNEDGTLGNIPIPVDTEASEMQKRALDSATQLLDMFEDKGSRAVGLSKLFMGALIPGTAQADFKAKYDNLQAQLQLDAVKYMKGQGQVSDSERKILADAISGLSRNQSDKAFKSTLQDIIVGLGPEGSIQIKDDGTYIYKRRDGEIHKGKIGDGYVDNTLPRNFNMSGITTPTNFTPMNFSPMPNQSQSVSLLQSIPDGLKGGQCGAFVNKITGLGVGDSYQSKIAKMDANLKVATPGMIFTMPYKDTGHIGFIIGIDGDHAIVKDSNYFINSNPETIATHRIPLSSITGLRALA